MTQKRDRPHKEWEDTVRRSYRILSRAVAVLAAVTVVGSGVRSASAIPTDPSDNPCISDSTFGLTISRPSVVWGQSVVLTATENAAPVANCSFTAANSFIQFTDKQSNVTYSEPFSFSDKLIPPAYGEAYQKHIPGSQLKLIANCGHLPMFEKEAEFVEAITRFCES